MSIFDGTYSTYSHDSIDLSEKAVREFIELQKSIKLIYIYPSSLVSKDTIIEGEFINKMMDLQENEIGYIVNPELAKELFQKFPYLLLYDPSKERVPKYFKKEI